MRKLYRARFDWRRLSALGGERIKLVQSSLEVTCMAYETSALSVESERHLRTDCSQGSSGSIESSFIRSICTPPLKAVSSCRRVERIEEQDGSRKMSSKELCPCIDVFFANERGINRKSPVTARVLFRISYRLDFVIINFRIFRYNLS